ncbi:uncharacterized protein B0H18DRAFT_952530 [Fomitopsis serialis]|uniref:uncharacterized protein n=1 Tax=Fomitopsis serialis TaxID=139415 RepID=UPI002008DF99|nr:uncharacterized protein B0H18DRAFT_952530 [Neoantrodia serialis]KAH9931856.1 hypothetical protein B0H18DRAFT_952530 [Neoantrodia serialis]
MASPHLDIHETEYPEERVREESRATPDDLNWIRRSKTLKLNPAKCALLVEQLRRNTETAQDIGYILVDIRGFRCTNGDNVWSNATKLVSAAVSAVPPVLFQCCHGSGKKAGILLVCGPSSATVRTRLAPGMFLATSLLGMRSCVSAAGEVTHADIILAMSVLRSRILTSSLLRLTRLRRRLMRAAAQVWWLQSIFTSLTSGPYGPSIFNGGQPQCVSHRRQFKKSDLLCISRPRSVLMAQEADIADELYSEQPLFISSRCPLAPEPEVKSHEEVVAPVRAMAQQMFSSGALSAAYYIGDALQIALWLFKKPLGVLIFGMGLAVLCNYVVGKIGDMLSPVCLVPVISTTPFCIHRTTFSPTVNKAPHSADLDKSIGLHGNFGGLLDTNADAGDIGTKLLQSEIATRDLVTLVRVSDLRSRNMLAGALVQLVEDAKRTGEGLHSLNATINGAVERITVVNDYAMSTMSAATVDDSPLSWIATTFSFYSGTPKVVIVQSYRDVMETLAAETERALLEASISAANLERLQEHLFTIHEICVREGLSLSDARAKLLSELWSVLGGNRDALRKAEGRLTLLAEVDQYTWL